MMECSILKRLSVPSPPRDGVLFCRSTADVCAPAGAEMDPLCHAIARTHDVDLIIIPYWAMFDLGVRFFFARGAPPASDEDLAMRVSPVGKQVVVAPSAFSCYCVFAGAA
jgi:hypothetical protein